jgi:hypothetical protein
MRSRIRPRLWHDLSVERDSERLIELQGELILVREELARLRFERGKGPDPSRIVAFVREVVGEIDDPCDREDEVWQVLADSLALRQTLIDTCREIELGMRALRCRLEAGTSEGLGLATAAAKGTSERNGSHPNGNGEAAEAVVAALLDELAAFRRNGHSVSVSRMAGLDTHDSAGKEEVTCGG